MPEIHIIEDDSVILCELDPTEESEDWTVFFADAEVIGCTVELNRMAI